MAERDIPPVPQNVDGTLRRTLESWRAELQRFMGYRGDEDDRAVRWRDLDAVPLRERLGSTVIGSTVAGGGGSGGAGSSAPDYTKPPSPTNIRISGTFSNVVVAWDMPTYTQGHGHQRTNVYATKRAASSSDQPTLAQAQIVDRAYAGTVIAIPSDPATRWNFWLTHETVDGIESDPVGGVNGFEFTTGRIGNADLGPLIIEAQNLASVDFTNLCSNGMGASTAGWDAQGIKAIAANWWGSASDSKTAFTFVVRDAIYTPVFVVNRGDQFTCKAVTVPYGGGASNFSFSIGIMFQMGDGSVQWIKGATREAGTVGAKAISGGLAAPGGAISGRVWVQIDCPLNVVLSALGDVMHATAIEVKRKATSDMLIDGIVQAQHMAANSIAVGTAAVENGAIRNAMIDRLSADRLQVVDADVVSMSASKILAGTLGVQRWISSIGYQPGQSGWAIFADGTAEFSSASIRGKLTANQIDGRGLAIMDTSGKTIVGMGSSIPADYLPGIGANLVRNSDFTKSQIGPWAIDSADRGGWRYTGGNGFSASDIGVNLSAEWTLAGGATLYLHQAGRWGGADGYIEIQTVEPIPVMPGGRYCLSVYTGAHRCTVAAFVYTFDSSGALIPGGHRCWSENQAETSGGNNLTGYKRQFKADNLPSNAVMASVVLRKYDTFAGQGDSWLFATLAQFEQVGSLVSEPSPWSEGAVPKITPRNISAFMESAAIGDAYIGNFIKSYNFDGSINPVSGAIDSVGTQGWAISKTGKMVVDAADIRGKIKADQVEAIDIKSLNVTSGTLQNASGTTFIDLNATGNDIVFRSGPWDPILGRYAVQIRADGDAQFSKLISMASWTGSVRIFSRQYYSDPEGGSSLVTTQTVGEFYIDTGYNMATWVSSEREFSARTSKINIWLTSGNGVANGNVVAVCVTNLSTCRGMVMFKNGAQYNQSQNPYGPRNDRIFIRVRAEVVRVDVQDAVDIFITQLDWRLYFGM